jgi:hypothetical protein
MRLRCSHRTVGWLMPLVVLAMAAMAGGCASYAVRGAVIGGSQSMVVLVSKDDPRVKVANGLTDVSLSFSLDPRSLGSKPLGATVTRADGTFEMPVDVFGAGTLEYELGVLARGAGYDSAQGTVPMPSGDQRVLVIMARGRDRYVVPDDPLRDIDRYRSR